QSKQEIHRRSARLRNTKYKSAPAAEKKVSTKGKGRRHIFKLKNPIKAPESVSTIITAESIFYKVSIIVIEGRFECVVFVLLFSHLSNSCDPMDCNLPRSSAHEISEARVLEWFAICSSSGSSHPETEAPSPALQVDSLPLSHLEGIRRY
uniref:Uncharacterized protein n=1 Tax=Capra hircus TaxID=9925 RepID=A0A8C2N9V8_CAPHI